jgi:tRNA threonylcarbamoyladenosine biosynthesis protein TsaE
MQTKELKRIIYSSEEMVLFGKEIALSYAKPPFILALKGDLGAGKTTFLKGFISTLTQEPQQNIQSPTFQYLQLYEGTITVYHFDLYRLNNATQFFSSGFADVWEEDAICCIEWAEKIESFLPSHTYYLEIHYQGAHQRMCHFYGGNLS